MGSVRRRCRWSRRWTSSDGDYTLACPAWTVRLLLCPGISNAPGAKRPSNHVPGTPENKQSDTLQVHSVTGTPFKVGDRITLKKQHPCGGREWDVYRIGADIGLRCRVCERRVMLTRREVERRMVARASA